MEKYFNQYAISLAISLIGCACYMVFVAVKQGIQSLHERDVVVVFLDFLAICSALKIVYLAFDITLCRPDSKVDLIFFAMGGVIVLLVAVKNITSKFKLVSAQEANWILANISHK